MLKVKYKYSGKEFILSPYNTDQEKDLLLLSTVDENDIDIALDICGVDNLILLELSHDEKLAMLYKMREISVGSEINVKFKCKKCRSHNENIIDIEGIIESSNIQNPKIKDCFKVLNDDNLQDFVEDDVEDMDLDEYEDVLREVKNSITKFNFSRPSTCQKCREINYIDISNSSFAVDLMSEDSLPSLYQVYNDLTFYGKYTKQDVDSMYPFERTILISLLNQTREEINK